GARVAVGHQHQHLVVDVGQGDDPLAGARARDHHLPPVGLDVAIAGQRQPDPAEPVGVVGRDHPGQGGDGGRVLARGAGGGGLARRLDQVGRGGGGGGGGARGG